MKRERQREDREGLRHGRKTLFDELDAASSGNTQRQKTVLGHAQAKDFAPPRHSVTYLIDACAPVPLIVPMMPKDNNRLPAAQVETPTGLRLIAMTARWFAGRLSPNDERRA